MKNCSLELCRLLSKAQGLHDLSPAYFSRNFFLMLRQGSQPRLAKAYAKASLMVVPLPSPNSVASSPAFAGSGARDHHV